jgi:hypothetical protein
VDLEALYQEGKADLKAERFQAALDKFEQGLSTPIPDRDMLWAYLIGAALACEGAQMLLPTMKYLNRFLEDYVRTSETVDEAWRARRDAMAEKKSQVLEVVLGRYGVVGLTSGPTGARVLVDAALYQKEDDVVTPCELFLEPGRHELTLTKDGFETARISVNVTKGRRESVNVPLAREEKRGELVVHSGAADAAIFVDGERRSIGTELVLPLREGEHLVQIDRPGHERVEKRVQVIAGQSVSVAPQWPERPGSVEPARSQVSRKPTRQATWHAKPWGWILGGTGLAAGVTGLVFALRAADFSRQMGEIPASLGPVEGERRYDELDSSRRLNNTVSVVLFSTGGTLLAGGIAYMLFSSGPTGRDVDADPAMSLYPLPGGLLVNTAWRW